MTHAVELLHCKQLVSQTTVEALCVTILPGALGISGSVFAPAGHEEAAGQQIARIIDGLLRYTGAACVQCLQVVELSLNKITDFALAADNESS